MDPIVSSALSVRPQNVLLWPQPVDTKVTTSGFGEFLGVGGLFGAVCKAMVAHVMDRCSFEIEWADVRSDIIE